MHSQQLARAKKVSVLYFFRPLLTRGSSPCASHDNFRRYLDGPGIPPQPFQIVIDARLIREDIDHVIAIVHQDPLGVPVSFDIAWKIAASFELLLNLIGDGLILPCVAAATDDQGIRETAYAAQIQHVNVFSLLGFGGANGCEPVGVRLGDDCLLG